MATQQTTRHPARARVRVAPFIVAAIAALALMAGLGIARLTPAVAPVEALPHGAATFDAVQFRADERDAWRPAPTFDAVGFRAEERQP